jgi:subtilisin family serine protease
VLYAGVKKALHVDTLRGKLSIATTGSTYGHNAGKSTFTLAASYWGSAHRGVIAFTGGASNPIETFSSDGPRKVFFNPDGTEITPGNDLFGTNGGTTLQKPDATAADGVNANTPGFLPFYGTSAAAPHAAAIAALVKGARPSLTGAQIRSILLSTALDNMAPGVDRDSGSGILMAQPAIQAALAF